jgi:hypothetical protein
MAHQSPPPPPPVTVTACWRQTTNHGGSQQLVESAQCSEFTKREESSGADGATVVGDLFFSGSTNMVNRRRRADIESDLETERYNCRDRSSGKHVR